MLAEHSLHVVLTQVLVPHVRDKVTQVRHATISDVVRERLRLSIERENSEARSDASVSDCSARHGR